jgi:D-glycero-D-manno-heptose 1,7-bisphosphate phosphatase
MEETTALRSARLMQFRSPSMARAVFLDRDGVLNRNVFYADTQAWESPRTADQVRLTDGIANALHQLRAAGYLLILVSNQPNAAKGKCTREELDRVHARVTALLLSEGISLDAHFLCFHHPDFTGPCPCRKPSPYFLFQAAAQFQIDLKQCWMIGDRASDVACGRTAGTATIWVDNGENGLSASEAIAADRVARSVPEAVYRLLAACPQ